MAVMTIVLKGAEFAIQKEASAAAAISPGDLVVLTSAGAVTPHNVAGHVATPAFAVEDALQGKTIEQQYAIADQVRYRVLPAGTEVNAFLAAGQSVARSALLMSNGAGAFTAAGASVALVRTLESLDNTSGPKSRIKVAVL